jgi:FkbM family methyltransferase
VVAIEPERMNYYTLCANVALNNLPQVTCLQNCVSDEPGVIYVPELDRSRKQNFGGLELGSLGENTCGNRVQVIRVDDLIRHNRPVRFMKIDVEGMEEKVLRGARQTIERDKPFLYIENDREEQSKSLLRLIQSMGYRVWDHKPPFWNPENHARKKRNIFPDLVSANIFCHPREIETPFDPATFCMSPLECV